jgi:hypothetical protein
LGGLRVFNAKGRKPLENYDVQFGIPGFVAASSTFSLTQHFMGGARVSIVPVDNKLIFTVTDTKGLNSLAFHIGTDKPRVPSSTTPFGNTYQKYSWSTPLNYGKGL